MSASAELLVFYELSSVLTGFETIELEGTGMAPDYYEVIDQQAGGDNLNALLAIFESAVATLRTDERPEAIRKTIMSDDRLGPLARNVIKLWYFGIWYKMPSDWRMTYGGLIEDSHFVISEQAYKQALVWRPMLAHAKGARQPGFASWQFSPTWP